MFNNQKLRKRVPFLAFVGCFMIGTTIGYIYENTTAGILIGLGVGLILMALGRFILRRRRKDNTPAATTEPEN